MNLKNFLYPLGFALLGGLVMTGCGKEDEEDPGAAIATFQYEINPENWAEVIFMNYSQNASTFAWDFGDGNTSTDTNPTHTYGSGGTYDVTLTATGATGSASRTETINIIDPNTAGQFLSGAEGKTWYLDREAIAMGIGPGPGDVSWWSFGGVTPLGERPCILDDAFTFNPDGTWEKNTNGTLFVDSDANGGWLGNSFETCYDETTPDLFVGPNGEDLSAFADGGDYTYNFDAAQSMITIEGFGAYIGLAQKTNNGDSYIPVSTKMYTVLNMETGANSDRMEIALVMPDGAAWTFYLVHYHDANDLPPIPIAGPSASFSYVKEGTTVTFTNTSNNATSANWDFGDGNFSTEYNPVHTYAADGNSTVTLSVSDSDFITDEASSTITISSAIFTAADLSTTTGKIWRLDGEGSYYVGPDQGSGAYWGGLDAAGVVERYCQMDDEFIFYDDGTFIINTQGDVWAESYMGGNNECLLDEELVAPFDVYGSGEHSFSATGAEITVNGLGAYIGFNKAYNGVELPGDGSGTPASTITYEVYEYSDVDGIQRLTITVAYGSETDPDYWNMRMISE